tara:strand:+ start:1341 stop:2285 length:945 start_codon:yes stop_codon:yes gene_type:complete
MKNVLSLFDGISCGRLALDKAGIEYDNYYASEIDKQAIDLVKKRFPSTKQLGNVEEWEKWDLKDVFLLMAGSPCQGFSVNGGQDNFNHPQSKLFFTFIDILRHYKPKYFLLENVKMRKEWVDKISGYVEITPIEINSSLVSAQSRSRLYWVNWPVSMPLNKNIFLKDILETNKDWKAASICGRRINPLTKKRNDNDSTLPYVQCIEVRGRGDKSGCLTTADKDSVVTRFQQGRHVGAYDQLKKNVDWRLLSMIEIERLQTLPDNYTEGYSDSARRKMIGNGWTVDVIVYLLEEMINKQLKKYKKQMKLGDYFES